MGVSQVFAGMTVNEGELFLENFKHIGFIKTQSSNNYVTDSAAAGTALACGIKTYNGAIGVNTNGRPRRNIREVAEKEGKSTGVVATSSITHATPASFVAHQTNRAMYEAIAADFLETDIDVFIGGGYKHFTDREDNRNLVNALEKKGYNVLRDMDYITKITHGKLAGLISPEHPPRYSEARGDMLPKATRTAIEILDDDEDGFFLMVEGSQIDWGGHQNNTVYIVEEMLDFDRAVGVALEFAAGNSETLIIVTADHETGGLGLNGGDISQGTVDGEFTTGGHTGVMVPVFAFGPGAERFTGIMENTDIARRIRRLMRN